MRPRVQAVGSADGMKQLHINISKDLHLRFKMQVVQDGRTMNEVIESLIEVYLDERQAPQNIDATTEE
ncbi:MAG: hypothetical protein JNL42_20015 [Anaerolineae bacterium]|nr:hypothetical protein [Anaerolineae bacterium]